MAPMKLEPIGVTPSGTERYCLNLGPQHPSTHGVLRVMLELDGETVVQATPMLGYLHRGIEKLAEARTYPQFIPYTDRLDYVSSMCNNLAYCQSVEKLVGVEVPERAEYIRVMMAELNRIASHMLFIGATALDLGGMTGMMYTFRDREYILDLFNLASGSRLTYSYVRIGGVMNDISVEFIDLLRKFLAELPGMMTEYDNLINGNEIFQARLKGVAVVPVERLVSLGVTGPVLRAAGLKDDLRIKKPYGIYNRFQFEIPTGTVGDNWERYMMRVLEIKESANIIAQALEGLPEGPVMAKIPKVIKPPVGEVYHANETPRGELGFYIVSDGTTKPYRLHIRRPTFYNLGSIDALCRGVKIADVAAVLAVLDPCMGEADA
ncbi:MAG TPA: NADH-quinone oxidoreductase subunit D [Negativicutes bacterium]|nr:NADH-quinone oxidoreductase subunit D [Negativicutes bacterium]